MQRLIIWLFAALLATAPAFAQIAPFPKSFKTREITTNGVTLHVRTGGQGPAVLLLHGYGETGDMWGELATDLARDHAVIVPDLRGMGLSSRPASGYDKKTEAEDMAGLLDALNVTTADLVTHDIGNMVGYALAAQHRDRITRFVIMDAPVPGVGPWEEVLKNPLLWHFRFGGPEAEKIVKGRERTYLDRFWNEFSANPKNFSEASRAHYAKLYAKPGAMKAGFAQFAAFDQDAIDNKLFLKQGKLAIPVLAVGGESSFGATMAEVMRFAADDVHERIIPGAGHWLMEENPKATVAAIRSFLDSTSASAKPGPAGEQRLTAVEVDALARAGAGAGTSGVAGIQTTILSGDPTAAGLYAIEIRVPPNTRIAAHDHRDARTAMVVSGKWYFGHGENAAVAEVKELTPGSFYTEPKDVPHFAFTRDAGATVLITGVGPTDTTYVDPASDPRTRQAQLAAPQTSEPRMTKAKSIVLVHGAFADGSAWSKVIPLLQAKGLNVISVQNPLTSLEEDVAHTRRAISRLEGPVVLVGHSWGGVVISEAGTDPKVSALVYVAAISPASGERSNDGLGKFPVSPGLATLSVDAQGFAVLPAASVATNFAQDLPAAETAVMAITQGPVQAGAFAQKVSKAAWESKPSWSIVTTQDRMLQPEYLRDAAKRIKATTVELPTSHVPQASMPEAVAEIILEAAGF